MSESVSAPRVRYILDVDQYLVVSTAFSVFLWQVLYSGVLNFYLGYVVLLGNCALLLARGELIIHRTFIHALAGIALVSITAATLTHNPIRAAAAQLVGVSTFLIYNYSVLHRTKYSLQRIMGIYLCCAKLVAVCGYPIWILHKMRGETAYRFCSWFAEPSHYVYATLPAVSYTLLKFGRDKKLDQSAIPMLVSYFLADSSTAYFGIAITILLMANLRSFRRILIVISIVLAGGWATYYLSKNFQLRVDQTIGAEIRSETADAITQKAQENNPSFGSNATTFALISNGYVASRAFLASPLIGNGLGTHTTLYDVYAPEIISPQFFLYGLNRDDANSLILRLLSETGLAGPAGILFLFIWFSRVKDRNSIMIRNAIIPYFFMRLIRFGAYFSMENFFFATVYGFNFWQSRRAAIIGKSTDD